MATIRRLSDSDVRNIFECVHHCRPPPPHLHFQVVPVGPEGLRLSPPSYEFEDGLYILLKPQKKKAPPSEQPKVPPHLKDFVIEETPPSSCPWSLSGPQFPQPTAIQQRYCYPKGNPHYSSRKGGALWTMYGTDGKENLEYRLLHVYFSAKRAVNKGIKAANKRSATVVQSTPKKKVKRTHLPSSKAKLQHVSPPAPQSHLSPARDCNSPLTFEYTPPSPTTMSPMYRANFVSPNVFEEGGGFHSPFRPRVLHAASAAAASPSDENNSVQFDQFHLDMDTTSASMQELEDACWNDPFFSSPHQGTPTTTYATKIAPAAGHSNGNDHAGQQQQLTVLKSGLEKMHMNVRERILSAPEAEQGALVSLFASWARQVAQDPLNHETIAQV